MTWIAWSATLLVLIKIPNRHQASVIYDLSSGYSANRFCTSLASETAGTYQRRVFGRLAHKQDELQGARYRFGLSASAG
jgi:hypothetical protein